MIKDKTKNEIVIAAKSTIERDDLITNSSSHSWFVNIAVGIAINAEIETKRRRRLTCSFLNSNFVEPRK